jgi:hypothetical protein
MKLKIAYSIILVCFLIVQCKQNKPDTSDQVKDTQPIAQKSSYKLEQVWASESDFKTPESVIYDSKRELFYVSNVNENPWEKDNNGFISKMSKTGEILDLEWITGFSGPKGMAIVDDFLFVADLDELVLIDINEGVVKDKVVIEGASGLNDITPGENSTVYITDSNEGKIFQYDGNAVKIFHDDAPGRPNGLLLVNGNLFTAFSQTSELVYFNTSTLNKTLVATGIGAGDGITPTNEKDIYLVSDWNGEIFMININGEKSSLLNTKDQGKNTADIWFIQEENLLLVPTFFDNRVVAYRLVKD